ncbi:MAG: hypothetical protein RR203_02505 [Synergistaceae bacterium]
MIETFTWKPFEVPKVKYGHIVKISMFESRKEQRKYVGRKPTEWSLTFKTTFTEMQQIQSFYQARGGSFESFYYVDLYSGNKYLVRFSDEDLEISTQWKKNGMFSFKFVEVL